MTSKEIVEVAVDELSQIWATRNRLLAEIEDRKAAVAEIDDILKARLPDEPSVVATIGGRPAFTYNYQSRYKEADFREEYPGMWRDYARPTLVDKMDWAKFAEDHPALAQKFQVRALVPSRPKRRS